MRRVIDGDGLGGVFHLAGPPPITSVRCQPTSREMAVETDDGRMISAAAAAAAAAAATTEEATV